MFFTSAVWGILYRADREQAGEKRDLRERGSPESSNHSCLGNAGSQGPPPPSTVFNELFPLQLKQPQDTGMSQPCSPVQSVDMGPGSGPRNQQDLGTCPLATVPHVGMSGPSSLKDDRELEICRAEGFRCEVNYTAKSLSIE